MGLSVPLVADASWLEHGHRVGASIDGSRGGKRDTQSAALLDTHAGGENSVLLSAERQTARHTHRYKGLVQRQYPATLCYGRKTDCELVCREMPIKFRENHTICRVLRVRYKCQTPSHPTYASLFPPRYRYYGVGWKCVDGTYYTTWDRPAWIGRAQ